MRLTRRKAIGGIAIGAVVAGTGLGTGAFSQIEADRSIDIEIDDDAEALLTLAPNDDGGAASGGASSIDGPGELEEYTGDANEYLDTEDGTLQLDISDEGVNTDATTQFNDLIRVENNASQDIRVRVDGVPDGLDLKVFGDEGTTSIVGEDYDDDVTFNVDSVAGITVEVDATEADENSLEGETVTIHAEAVAWLED